MTRTKQPAVEWLSVPALWQRTRGQIVSHVAVRFVDPRAAFASRDASVEPFGKAARAADDVWVDYVADVGDGYQATRAVAFCQAQALDGTMPGELLVLGGDEVYPVASRRAYEQRFRAPYEGLIERRAAVLAVPGNHDWYDRLRSFPEVFTTEGQASLPNAAAAMLVLVVSGAGRDLVAVGPGLRPGRRPRRGAAGALHPPAGRAGRPGAARRPGHLHRGTVLAEGPCDDGRPGGGADPPERHLGPAPQR